MYNVYGTLHVMDNVTAATSEKIMCGKEHNIRPKQFSSNNNLYIAAKNRRG